MFFINMIMKISSIIPILNKNAKKASTYSAAMKTMPVKDVFEKSSTQKVVESARDFTERVLKPFVDWKHPESFEKDSALVSSLFKPYIEMISDLKKKDAEHFAKLVFGEDTVESIQLAGKRNPDVKLFIDTVEDKLGCSISKAIGK